MTLDQSVEVSLLLLGLCNVPPLNRGSLPGPFILLRIEKGGGQQIPVSCA